MIKFLIGLFIGLFLGIIVMSLMKVSTINDLLNRNEELEQQLKKNRGGKDDIGR